MFTSNAALDRADELAEQERQSGINAASKALSGPGLTHCVECGGQIGAARLEAIPSARRCVGCQTAHEDEQASR